MFILVQYITLIAGITVPGYLSVNELMFVLLTVTHLVSMLVFLTFYQQSRFRQLEKERN
jgi:hypothetical protein